MFAFRFPIVRSPLVLTSLVACGVALWALQSAAGQEPPPRVIEITARRFAFEPALIEAAVGERLRLVVRSADGVHGVEIEKFRVKKEVPRGGTPVEIEFTAGEAGRFPILCSEYCGNGHDDMTGMLVVTAGAPAER